MDFHFNTYLSCMTNNPASPNSYKNLPCSIGIFTTGNSQMLAFCNEPHIDTMDTYSMDETTEYLNILKDKVDRLIHSVGSWDSEAKKNAEDFSLYVHKFNDTLTLGVPTTCAYQHVLEDITSTLIQFFVMEGLGTAVYLPPFIGHNFISHSFVHHTSLCVALDRDGRVWIDNKNGEKDIGYLFAWGGSGNHPTNATTARNRNTARRRPIINNNVAEDVEVAPIHPDPNLRRSERLNRGAGETASGGGGVGARGSGPAPIKEKSRSTRQIRNNNYEESGDVNEDSKEKDEDKDDGND